MINPPYFYYWAKAMPNDEGAKYHSFPYHCLDVVAVADAWLSNSSALRKTFLAAWGYSDFDVFRAWLLFFIGLHDLGKLDLNFQLKVLEVAKALFPSEYMQILGRIRPQQPFDHGQAGYAWFVHLFPQTKLANHDLDQLSNWMAAVAGHHGTLNNDATLPRLKAPQALYQLENHARLSWIAQLDDMFLLPVQAHGYELPPLPPKLLAGFCSVCDWVGSNTDYFKYNETPADLSSYLEKQRDIASQALQDAGLIAKPLKQGGMSYLFSKYIPQGLQKQIDNLPLRSGVTIIEAPTGSGKTEAALAYASRLLAEGYADSIIFALPTQATANAMLERLAEVASALFPESKSNLLLAHGKARFHERFKGLKRLGLGLTAQAFEEAGVHCSHWLGSSRKRVFLGQIGVCTIDQVLLSVLPVRHHFVRSFGVGKSILIVDEIHAYDSYMNSLLDRVLESQQRMGSSAILLSATLPNKRLQRIATLWKPGVNIESLCYPLLTQVTESSVFQLESPDATPTKTVSISLEYTALARPTADLIQEIICAAESGAAIAVVCNLVDDALAVYHQLKQQNQVAVDLFHSRFRFIDRMAKEADVMRLYGKATSRLEGRILVATQVVEQSLDLDFDWMITQICPVDLLFQRLGRLHRHNKNRPESFTEPRCTVLCPVGTNQTLPDYGFHQLIYGDIRVLWRTEQLLKANSDLVFPGIYREWIEKVYAEMPWENESQPLTHAHEEYAKDQDAKAAGARTLSVSNTSPYRDTDATAARLTRDGEMALSVIPLVEHDGLLCLLDGKKLEALMMHEKDEVLSLNTVPVPDSWQKCLPPAEDGLYFLKLIPDGEIWVLDYQKYCFYYHPQYGLERKQHESTY